MSRSKRVRGENYHYSNTVSGLHKGIKDDKRLNNKLLRNKAKHVLRTSNDLEEVIIPTKLEEVMERWTYRDDGRGYWPPSDWRNKPWHYKFK